MAIPEEIIVSPYEVYLAVTGTAFPLIDVAPAAAWKKLGTSGNKSMSEDGVAVNHPQTIQEFRAYGSTGPIKAWRTEESLVLSFTIIDLLLEEYQRIINDNSITTVAAGSGTAGHKRFSLLRGSDVNLKALLVRGPSPYLADHNAQYEVDKIYEGGSPTVTYSKGAPAGLSFELHAIEDLTNGFGVLRAAHTVAT